jgi:hypothetical protein
VKQKHWKEQKVHQCLYLFPNCAVQGGESANQIADQNEGKVREEKLSVIHQQRIPAKSRASGVSP